MGIQSRVKTLQLAEHYHGREWVHQFIMDAGLSAELDYWVDLMKTMMQSDRVDLVNFYAYSPNEPCYIRRRIISRALLDGWPMHDIVQNLAEIAKAHYTSCRNAVQDAKHLIW